MPHAFARYATRPNRRVPAGEPVTVNAARAPGPSGSLRCRCGAVALRHVGTRGYCAAHQAEAWRAAAREAGHASPDALLHWIDGMNIEEEA